ncbi:hypothetical protein D3C72_689230 [compost metagenome]
METKSISETNAANDITGGSMATKDPSATKSLANNHNSLRGLLEHQLNDIYSAEMQLTKALPEMAKACNDEELQDAFLEHLDQTKKHVERLEKIFIKLRIEKTGESCKAMEGLIQENKKIILEFEESPVRDSALIIGAQKVEHYEIASYGSVSELADVLGLHKVADLLERTLQEEEFTDKLLSEIAMDINDDAYETEEQSSR